MSAAIRLKNGLVIAIQELTPWYNFGSVGFKLWPASKVLISFLESHEAELLRSTAIVELGSGSGACGLAASALGSPFVLLTDRPVNHIPRENVPFPQGRPGELMLDFIKSNIRLNSKVLDREVMVKQLVWGESDDINSCQAEFSRRGHRIGLVIGSDVTYHSSGHAALFSTAASLLSPPGISQDGSTKNVLEKQPDALRFVFSHQHRGYKPEDTFRRLVDHAIEAGFQKPEQVVEHRESPDEIICVYECILSR